MNEKNGTAYIKAITHTFLRGTNFENKVVIIDEAQNYYFDELKKVNRERGRKLFEQEYSGKRRLDGKFVSSRVHSEQKELFV